MHIGTLVVTIIVDAIKHVFPRRLESHAAKEFDEGMELEFDATIKIQTVLAMLG